MVFLLKPYGCRVSIVLGVVRQVSAGGMQRNRNSSSRPPAFFVALIVIIIVIIFGWLCTDVISSMEGGVPDAR